MSEFVNPNQCDNPNGPCACGAWHETKPIYRTLELCPPIEQVSYDNGETWQPVPQLTDNLTAENARLLKRVNDLEVAVANGMNDATRFVDRNGWLESEHQRLKQENDRLRGLLRECREYVPIDLQEFIKAELGSE